MKKLLLAVSLVSLCAMASAKEQYDDRSGSSAVKPCMIQFGQHVYMNANQLQWAKVYLYRKGDGYVEYVFGRYNSVAINADNPQKVLDSTLAEIERKCK